MSAPPYMKFFVGDYLADTTHLTTVEHGAYLLLLMAMWRAGGKLPSDPARLARVTLMSVLEWTAIAPTILELFSLHGRYITHGRITKDLARVELAAEAQRKRREREQNPAAQQNQLLRHDKLSHISDIRQGREITCQVVEYESENVVPLSPRTRKISAEEFS